MKDDFQKMIDSLNDPSLLKRLKIEAEEAAKKREEKRKIVKSHEYMDWLENYISTNSFATDSTSFPCAVNSKKDEENIGLLSTLFSIVDDNILLFDDIVNNRDNPRKYEIERSLELFKSYVSNLLDRGIPKNTLQTIFDEQIKRKTEEKSKKYVKK